MRILSRLLLCVALGASSLHAQKGDRSDAPEKQISRVPTEKIPPAPVMSPEDALKTFKLQPGFRIELVAGDDLVHDPVHSVFDPDGRLWVVEMSGYMHDFVGTGETQPVGKVVVLQDTNNDGRMDKRTEFVDGLVMPHSVSVVRDGVLVGEPPNLWFCRDTNADLKCDEKTLVAKDYGNRSNPEHTANGLYWARDNWIYSAGWTYRLRSMADGSFKRDITIPRGQYGISQDDDGRLVYNSNSDQFRIDLVPARYLQRNPNFRSPMGVNVDPIRNQATFPIRVNPGVNRGYREGTLRADGTLATFTAACSPLIYRGDQFPKEFYGNAFVCEPSANLVKRNILWEENGTLLGRQAYTNAEFLASTDERFRPVHLSDGPDGALYITDFYRGVIQHHTYLTSYLREQSASRKLQQPVGLGRIYRIVHEGKKAERMTFCACAETPSLVGLLSNPNGWIRDNAQRLLVERNDSSAIPALKELASGDNVQAASHALWTLEGMGRVDLGVTMKALAHASPKIRVAAVRLAEPGLKDEDGIEILDRLSTMTRTEASAEVQLQLAFTIAETLNTERILAGIAANFATNIYIRHAILSGLGGRETRFLEMLLADAAWRDNKPGRANIFHALGQCVLVSRRADDVNRLFELMLTANAWQRTALLDGAISTAPKKGAPKLVRFAAEPATWKKINALKEKETAEKLKQVSKLVTWPGKPGYVPPPKVKPLAPEEQQRFETGKQLYAASCAGCHQLSGLGMEGLAPPLADSEWVLGSDQRLTQIVLLGVRGPITVKGRTYSLEMPGLRASFDDEQITSVLTYIRREWDHTANAVAPATVKKLRAKVTKRNEAWSEGELLKMP
jgi:glucose/arabinose dehydrogenase/mono/diheme cytochrome c family protein